MIKKLIQLLIITSLLLIPNNLVFSDELITDFEEDSVPVLNEELRKIQETNNNLQTQIDDLTTSLGNASPTGSVTAWTTSTAPTDWLLCDGSAVSRTTYSDLFAVVSTIFGVGDGSTTFNVPDLIGRVVVMKDDGDVRLTNADAIADSGGAEDGVGTHRHTVKCDTDTSTFSSPEDHYIGELESSSPISTSGFVADTAPEIMASDAINTSGTTDGNLQPYLTLIYIIKT